MALYFGGANQGLGFFHVDLTGRDGRTSQMMSFDNCAVSTIEEGEISNEEIIENLKIMFDPEWPWVLREIGDYKHMVRFPHTSNYRAS